MGGRSKHQRTGGAKRKFGTLHASCANGNLNNRPSDPLPLNGPMCLDRGQTLITCRGCARCGGFIEGRKGGLFVVVDLENGVQPGHLQEILNFFGEVDEL